MPNQQEEPKKETKQWEDMTRKEKRDLVNDLHPEADHFKERQGTHLDQTARKKLSTPELTAETDEQPQGFEVDDDMRTQALKDMERRRKLPTPEPAGGSEAGGSEQQKTTK